MDYPDLDRILRFRCFALLELERTGDAEVTAQRFEALAAWIREQAQSDENREVRVA